MLLCIYKVCSYDQRTLWSLHDRLKKKKIKGEIKKRLLRGRLMASWACVTSSQPCWQPSLDSVRSSLMRLFPPVKCSCLP